MDATERDAFIELAQQCSESSSRLEDTLVDASLEKKCRHALDLGDDTDIEAALSALKEEESPAYEELLSMAEECAQSIISPRHVSLLVLIPILAWSRYKIPFGKLSSSVLEEICNIYRRHFTNPQAKTKIRIGSCLVSSDHLPDGLAPVRSLLNELSSTQPRKANAICDISALLTANPPPDFSDSRFLVLSVTGAAAGDLFANPGQGKIERAQHVMGFSQDCHRLLTSQLIGTVFQVQCPCSFFSAWRQTDASMQIFALKALVDFVCCMGFETKDLIATAAIFTRPHPNDTDPNNEIRIGMSLANDPNHVIAGVIWPVATGEPEDSQQAASQVLAACGIPKIVTLDQTFPMEWCEDCGAPLYAAANGMVTHIEVPESLKDKNFNPPTLN